jgi:tellurite resistance protein TerC
MNVWSIPLIILQLIVLEGLLSIDNAAVLGALVVPLPSDKPIEWPRALAKFGKRMHPLLGNQRSAALRVGLLGAYLGRGLMLALASVIISNPWLKIVGAIYLIRLAFDNLGMAETSDEEGELRSVKASSFWGVVLTVEMADLAFSLDNVVAAVSLSKELWVVIVGVFLGILFMRFAAGLFSYAVEREPILKSAAYLLVFNIGVELLLEDIWKVEIADWMRFTVSITTILLCLLYAHSDLLQRIFRPLVYWVAQGFSRINALADWVLMPLGAIFNLFKRLIKLVFRSPRKEAA